MKRYMLTFLFDRSSEGYEENIVLLRLFNRVLKSPTLVCFNWLFMGMDKQSFQTSSVKHQQLDRQNKPKVF